MAPKRVTIVEPPKQEESPVLPPPESPEEITARPVEEQVTEQQELDNTWKKIPYIDQKYLGPGNYAGIDMMQLFKPWHYVCKCLLLPLKTYSSLLLVCQRLSVHC